MWDSLNTILHRKPESVLPDCSSFDKLANSFGSFFMDKISKIMITLTEMSQSCKDALVLDKVSHNTKVFDKFTSVTEQDVRKLILNSPAKQCAYVQLLLLSPVLMFS